MKTVGVVLSGCGVLDGAEIHESVLTMLALDRAGAEVLFLRQINLNFMLLIILLVRLLQKNGTF